MEGEKYKIIRKTTLGCVRHNNAVGWFSSSLKQKNRTDYFEQQIVYQHTSTLPPEAVKLGIRTWVTMLSDDLSGADPARPK